MADSKLIKEAINVSLKNSGLKKKSNSWYWSNNDVVQVINLQKSQYGDQYYLNFGIGLIELGISDFPKEQHCHIRFRAAAVVSDELKLKIESALDLESMSMSDEERASDISELIREVILPVFSDCSSKNGVLYSVKRGLFFKAMVHKKIKELNN
jgi:hypothetical protein